MRATRCAVPHRIASGAAHLLSEFVSTTPDMCSRSRGVTKKRQSAVNFRRCRQSFASVDCQSYRVMREQEFLDKVVARDNGLDVRCLEFEKDPEGSSIWL